MKFGSVKFFKVLIIVTLLAFIIIPFFFAVFFGLRYYGEKRMVQELSEVNRSLVEEYVNRAREKDNLSQGSLSDEQSEGQGKGGANEQGSGTLPGVEGSHTYQSLYPHLYVDALPAQWVEKEYTCYLTFDDGPSAITGQILQTLEKNEILATFFVTGDSLEQNEDLLRKAALAGHTIAVHTWSHDYRKIYASVEAFLEDFDQIYRKILEVTGTAPTIFRFPGGSINAYNQTVYSEIIAEMTRRGFVYYDWNASASDAVAGGITKKQALQNVLNSVGEQTHVVVLMHDRADTKTTAEALPDIIKALKDKGFSFEPLTNEVKPVIFSSLD